MRAFAEETADYATLIQTVARRVSETLGAYCAVVLLSEDGEWLNPVASHDPDAAKLAEIRSIFGTRGISARTEIPSTLPLRTGEPAFMRTFDPAPFIARATPVHAEVV